MQDTAYEALMSEVKETAARYGNPGCFPTMTGILASILLREREEHARKVKALTEPVNESHLLESMSQEIRASSIQYEYERDELVDYLKQMIKELETLDEFEEEGPDTDLLYESQRDIQMGWA